MQELTSFVSLLYRLRTAVRFLGEKFGHWVRLPGARPYADPQSVGWAASRRSGQITNFGARVSVYQPPIPRANSGGAVPLRRVSLRPAPSPSAGERGRLLGEGPHPSDFREVFGTLASGRDRGPSSPRNSPQLCNWPSWFRVAESVPNRPLHGTTHRIVVPRSSQMVKTKVCSGCMAAASRTIGRRDAARRFRPTTTAL